MKIKLLNENATVPTFANPGDAGADLYASEWEIFHQGEAKLIKTGIALEIPLGYFGLVRPRSGLAKHGLTMESSGVIDSGYRGEIMVNLRYNGNQPVHYINLGDRIAQILFLPVIAGFDFQIVDDLSESARGNGGFGSTGGWTA